MTSEIFNNLFPDKKLSTFASCCHCSSLHLDWLERIFDSEDLDHLEKREMVKEVIEQAKNGRLMGVFSTPENLNLPLKQVFVKFSQQLDEHTNLSNVTADEEIQMDPKDKVIMELQTALVEQEKLLHQEIEGKKEYKSIMKKQGQFLQSIPDLILNIFNGCKQIQIPVISESQDEQNFFYECVQDIFKTLETQLKLTTTSFQKHYSEENYSITKKFQKQLEAMEQKMKNMEQGDQSSGHNSAVTIQNSEMELKLRKYKRIMAKLKNENDELRSRLEEVISQSSKLSIKEVTDKINACIANGEVQAKLEVKPKSDYEFLQGRFWSSRNN